jgi:GTPase SAR1 family protein
MVYDITNQESFDDIASKWIPQMKQYGSSDILKYLVGTKSDFDSKAKVDSKKAKELATAEGFQYFETSSKIPEGLDKLFDKVGKDCIAARPEKEKTKNEKDKKEIKDAEAGDKKKCIIS